MEALLKPDYGLIFWTVINFLVLVFLLAKFAWKPLTAMLDGREKKIAADIAAARAANEDAQKIKAELKTQLETVAQESLLKMKQAAALGEREKQKILDEAKEQAAALLDAARQQIKADTAKAVQELKEDFIETTMQAVKKVISLEADAKTNKKMVEDFLEDIKAK